MLTIFSFTLFDIELNICGLRGYQATEFAKLIRGIPTTQKKAPRCNKNYKP